MLILFIEICSHIFFSFNTCARFGHRCIK